MGNQQPLNGGGPPPGAGDDPRQQGRGAMPPGAYGGYPGSAGGAYPGGAPGGAVIGFSGGNRGGISGRASAAGVGVDSSSSLSSLWEAKVSSSLSLLELRSCNFQEENTC